MAIYEKKKWEESEDLKKQQQALEAYKATKPGAYSSPNQIVSAEALKNWQNYKPFEYNVNADALYKQYKNNYMTQGKLAMQDTAGQAAALTGGYGSSYAQNVGQQAYQGYLQKLNDVVPALQEAAYNRHLQGKEDAFKNWQMAQAMEEQDYGRYVDELNRYNAEYNRLYGEYTDAYDREYSQFQYDDQRDYQQYQDALSQENWQKQFDADQAYRNWQMSQASGSRPNTVTAAYDNSGINTADIKAMQRYLGMPETGYWDETSYRAAGGLTAAEAWKRYNNSYNDIDSGELFRELQADSAYVNDYLAQTPTGTANAYQYAQGMYDPVYKPLSNSERKDVLDRIYSYDFGGAKAAIEDLSAQGYDVNELWRYYNEEYKKKTI